MADDGSIGTLVLHITAEGASFTKELSDASGEMEGFGSTVVGAFTEIAAGAAVGVAALAAAAVAVASFVEEQAKMSLELTNTAAAMGVTTDTYQTLMNVGKETGAGADQLARSVFKLHQTIEEANEGNTKYQLSLAALGLDYKTLKDETPEQQLQAVASAFEAAGDRGAAYQAIMEILGSRSAPRMQEALKLIATDGLAGLTNAMKENGQIMSTELIAKLDEAQKNIEKFEEKWTVLKGELAGGVVGAVDEARLISTPDADLKSVQDITDKIAILKTRIADVQKETQGSWFSALFTGTGGAIDTMQTSVKELQDRLDAMNASQTAAATSHQKELAAASAAQDALAKQLTAQINATTNLGSTWDAEAKQLTDKQHLYESLTAVIDNQVTHLGQLDDMKQKGIITDKQANTLADQLSKTIVDSTQAIDGLVAKYNELANPALKFQNEITSINAMLKDGKITYNVAQVAIDQLNRSIDQIDRTRQFQSLTDLQRILADVDKNVRDVVSSANTFVASSADKGTKELTGDSTIDALITSQNQELTLTNTYNAQKLQLQKAYDTTVMNANKANDAATKKQYQDQATQLQALMLESDDRYLARVQAVQTARTHILVQAASSTFDSLASVMSDAFGKQSAAYKIAFGISKAFAIADSLISIQQGIAKAYTLGWPAGIVAAASIAAQTASIISNISAVALTFEGGGYTGGGVRGGGLDGHGGFMAMLHPQEQVIDLTKGQSPAADESGGNTHINITQQFTGGVTKSDLQASQEATKQNTIKAVMDGVQRGGQFRRALQR